MSSTVIRPSWQGFANLQYLVIFGDSYSDVGYNALLSNHPTVEDPLGVDFPGYGFVEPGAANWVGHLITNYANHKPLLVYDYAVGGDDVSGVRKQVQVRFLPRLGEKPDWAPWLGSNTLFITWIGINDCGYADDRTVSASIKQLFNEQEDLYKVGARNFLFIDVPPIHRTPIGLTLARTEQRSSDIYELWNTELREAIIHFSTAHSDVTTLLFSSWATFIRVLDDPMSHGFEVEDVVRNAGRIWVDHLHPTSRMHDWIARDLAEFLSAQPAYLENVD
ncbi:hypothetical protein BKA93DRAFT_896374 [Sparassis latifolia]